MTDLTTQLGALVREQQAREAAVEELAERARAGEDTLELERRLGIDARVALSAFEPLSAAAQARFTEAIHGALSAPAAIPKRRSLERLVWLGPLLAAAAAIALWLWPSRLPMLEEYELQVYGTVARERGASPASSTPLALVPGTRVTLLLRPESAPSRQVTARVFLRSNAGESALPATVTPADSGTLKLDVALGAVPLSGELLVLVGVPELLDRSTSAARLLASHPPSGPGWQRISRRFIRADSP